MYSKYVEWTNEQIDSTELFIENNYAEQLTGLNREEREYKKLQIALFIDTTTNLLSDGKTIWSCEPEDWELC